MLSGVPTAGIPFLGKLAAHPKLLYLTLSGLRMLPKRIASKLIIYGSFVTVLRPKDVDEALIEGVLEADPKTAAELLKSICETRLDSVSCPERVRIVVVRGERDRIASRQSLEKLALALQASYYEINQSGHTPMLESPTDYNRIVLDLLHAPVGGESEWTEQRLHSKA
jgi:pimeloyl-ACP methyl ester carboxylesterase